MTDTLRDRRDIPIFIHSTIDDMGLTTDAFRVYCHLARRANQEGVAWPKQVEVGKVCFFGDAVRKGKPPSEDYCRHRAMLAIDELIERGMLTKVPRYSDGHRTSNEYQLTPQSEWTNSTQPEASNVSNNTQSNVSNNTQQKVLQVEGTPNNIMFSSVDHSLTKSATSTTSQQEMVGTLARVCGMDAKLVGGRLGRAAKSLLAGGYNPAEVRHFEEWWYKNNFLGKKGQAPKPEQVLEEILRSRNGGNEVHNPRPNMAYDAENRLVLVEPDPDPWEP